MEVAGRIHILPENIANQIAAGEVVERPSNVIKELVENSLDANATQIDVQFYEDGTAFMQVSDNGIGMDETNALLCFKRHATSKLNAFTDLQTLQSFGFRGEALPSIASVSKMTLVTRTKQQSCGIRIELDPSKDPDHPPTAIPCACSVGTTVSIERLFFNVPVRRKFLRSPLTESAHIIECIRLYALAYPQVHFRLRKDNTILFSSPYCSTIEDRIQELWQKWNDKHWIAVDHQENAMAVTGVISPPGDGSANNGNIYLFLNQRPIVNTTLQAAIRDAYGQYLPSHLYPSAFLFLQIPGNEIDINVHPMKREVRFHREPAVRALIKQAIQNALSAYKPLVSKESPSPQPLESLSTDLNAWVSPKGVRSTMTVTTDGDDGHPQTFTVTLYSNEAIPGVSPEADSDDHAPSAADPKAAGNLCTAADAIPAPDGAPQAEQPEAAPLNFLAIWQKRFVIFDDSPFLLILDSHGAQMRLWYDRTLALLKQEQVGALQGLLFPYTFALDGIQAACLHESIDYLNFKKMCTIQALSEEQFQLTAIPQWMPPENVELFIDQIVNNLVERGQTQTIEHQLEPLLLKLCAKRVFTPISTPKEAERLSRDLQTCENYITTPLGKPIWKRFSANDLLTR